MTEKLTLAAEASGERLDVALAKYTDRTRSQVQKLLKENRIKINGEFGSARTVVGGGEEIIIAPAPEEPTPAAPNIPILFEDKDMIVIDKPAGLVVHLSETGRPQPTVAAFAATRVEDTDTERPGIVHRLDKETSGVLVIAKTPESKDWLQKQFQERKVDKHYVALVAGRLKEHEATINLPIGRSRKQPTKRAVLPGGRPSVTHYKVEREIDGATLVDVVLETGRTHQIRVHFAHIGHPVIGDDLYGNPDPKLHRFFLHAASISIDSPSGRRMTINSPLPTELKTYLAERGAYNT